MRKLLLFFIGIFSILSCDVVEKPSATGEVRIVCNNKTSSVRSAGSLEDIVRARVSIEDAAGNVIQNGMELTVSKFGSGFVSEQFSLPEGDYQLTEYTLVNASGDVIFAAPKANSEKGYLVSTPLPIPFSVLSDAVSELAPEIISTESSTPKEFGYLHFNLNLVETFQFYAAVSDRSKLLEADITISSGAAVLYSGKLGSFTNRLTVQDGHADYVITVECNGYDTFTKTFTKAELKRYSIDEALIITLNAGSAPAVKSTLVSQWYEELPVQIEGGEVVGDIAYAADFGVGQIHVIDIREPHNPTVISTLKGGSNFEYTTLAVDGNILAAGARGYVQIFDISNPENPVFLGECATAQNGLCWTLQIEGNRVYTSSVQTTDQSLYVINIENPTAPEVVGHFKKSADIVDFLIKGGFGYLVTGSDVEILDLSNSSDIQMIGAVKAPAEITSAEVDGDTLFLMNRDGDLELYNVSDPVLPLYVNKISLPGMYQYRDIKIDHDAVYLSDGDKMVQIEKSKIGYGNNFTSWDLPSKLGAHRTTIVPYGAHMILFGKFIGMAVYGE